MKLKPYLFAKRWWVGIALSGVLIWLVAFAMLTDPYSPYTVVRSPYQTQLTSDGEIELVEVFAPKFRSDPLSRMTGFVRAGARIALYRWIDEPRIVGSESSIIEGIYTRRFQVEKPYVITGAHYSDLYIRNLGIFYDELLTPLPGQSSEDWQARQRLGLQTVALNLAFLRHNQKLVTTIVPLGGRSFTGVNIYSEPSDSLHAVLFTLDRLRDPSLQTFKAARQLIEENKRELYAEVGRYVTTVIDPSTSFVKEDIYLSSARDGVKRKGAFYDTVIAWRTVQLAKQLGLVDEDSWPEEYALLLDTVSWKEKILDRYWKEDRGHFANDLYDESFSGDSFIAFSTGFLNPTLPDDAQNLVDMLTYVQREGLDQPFPLRYSRTTEQNELHFVVKMFASAYMGDSIWSHWGIEYIKTLLAVAEVEPLQRCSYLKDARKHLKAYEDQIVRFGGFPELYAGEGGEFKTIAVRGVLQSGWVVNYQVAQAMAEKHLSTSSCDFAKGLLQ